MSPAPHHPGRWTASQLAVVAWSVGGVLLLLAQALWRLTPIALQPLRDGMTGLQWSVYFGWILVNGYAEGYRAFQLRFSPRVVARALHVARHPRPLHVALAPLFCMSFFHATSRGRAAAWGVTLGVVAAILVIRLLPQPWRGILDAGVVVGLGWGAAALIVSAVRGLRGLPLHVDAQLPSSRPPLHTPTATASP